MFLEPGTGPRSRRHTDRPPRAAASAAADPGGPAPTTTTSNDSAIGTLRGTLEPAFERRDEGGGVGHDREVGQRHHRAARIQVDRHDVSGMTEAAHVLERAGD